MGGSDKQTGDEIFVTGRHARTALAAAPLGAIGRKRHTLDITGMRDGHNHVLTRDQILVVDVGIIIDDHRAACCRMRCLDGGQFVANNLHDPDARAQDFEIIGNFNSQSVQFFGNFIPAQRCQALQTQIENSAGLGFRQAHNSRIRHRMAGIIDQSNQRSHIISRPVTAHQGITRRLRIGR